MTAYQNTVALIRYLLAEARFKMIPIIFLAVAAGGSKTLMIFVINETAERGGADIWMFLGLMAAVVVSLASAHYARVFGAALVQDLAVRLRRTVSEHVLNADVAFFQKRDFGQIYAAMTGQADAIATTITRLAEFIQAFSLLVFCLIYMSLQSWPSGVATLVPVLGTFAFLLSEGPARRVLHAANQARIAFYDAVNDMLRGYKELRLREARRRGLAQRIEAVTEDARQRSVEAERFFSYGQVAAAAALALLLVAIVVVLPMFAQLDSIAILQVLTIVLLTSGPIEAVVSGLPGFARASVAYRNFTTVLEELDRNPEAPEARDVAGAKHDFSTIELREVTVTLHRPSPAPGSDASDSFTVGPINMTLTPGQSVFVTGGNGMGKSTLLQVLTGLRHPDGGQIVLDGEPVTRENIGKYRELFSAVFSEFYLFRRLYGLNEEERDRMQQHIQALGLAEGVSITEDSFSSLNLSTGQMRRLALSVALAEESPVVVLDEFAADQDPVRRAFFYDILLPRLSGEGRLVVAVTHDEHCFGKSDRLIRMEDGVIVSDSTQDPVHDAALAHARP